MADERFNYNRINVVKVIIHNGNGQVLLIQEPSTNEWMPNHWGLPGGKPYINESLLQTFYRKMIDDLGINAKPQGVVCIQELLRPNNSGTVLMFIFALQLDETHIKDVGEIQGFKWVGLEELRAMEVIEFTEFYNKSMLVSFLEGGCQIFPLDIIKTWEYFNIEGKNNDYDSWFDSGTIK